MAYQVKVTRTKAPFRCARCDKVHGGTEFMVQVAPLLKDAPAEAWKMALSCASDFLGVGTKGLELWVMGPKNGVRVR